MDYILLYGTYTSCNNFIYQNAGYIEYALRNLTLEICKSA